MIPEVEPAIFALRCAYLGEADAGRTMEEEHRHLRPLLPAPVPPPAPPPPVAKAEKAPQAVPEKLKNHKKKCPQRQVALNSRGMEGDDSLYDSTIRSWTLGK